MRQVSILFFIVIFIVIFIGCNNISNETKEKELELKKKELEIKEKEFNFEITKHNQSTKKVTQNNSQKSEKKELVYLYTAIGGMVGYFNDGSVVGCPRCDFCKSNILSMFKEKPMSSWDLKQPDAYDPNDNCWVLVNYEWKEKVPQI